MAEQVNVFVDNKPGRINRVTEILFRAGVNIRAAEIQDRGDFGVIKLLVNDPQKAHLALSDEGLASALKQVVAIIIEDKPGGLHSLMEVFEKHDINVIDAYGFVVESAKEAIWCVEVENPEAAAKLIADAGFRILSDDELYDL